MANKLVDWATSWTNLQKTVSFFCSSCIGCSISHDTYEVFAVNFRTKVFFGEFPDKRYHFGTGLVFAYVKGSARPFFLCKDMRGLNLLKGSSSFATK